MQKINKFCADRLRVFSNNHGVKLKSGHAHELVAAFFGYASKATMYADTQYPTSNLFQANIIILPPMSFTNQRREELKDLPFELPDNDTLIEVIFTSLAPEAKTLNKLWWHDDIKRQAILLAHQYLHHQQLSKLYHTPSHEVVDVDKQHDGILLTITPYHPVADYRPDGSGKNSFTSLFTTIWLKRIAGHIGYAEPEINARPIPMIYQPQS